MRGKIESKFFFEIGAQLFFEIYNLTIWNSESYNLSKHIGNLFPILSHGLQSGVPFPILKPGGLQ